MDQLVIHSEVKELPKNKDFSVEVRQMGGEWEKVPTYLVRIDMHNVRNSSAAYFDFNGQVEVKVISNSRKIENVKIRPEVKQVSYEHDEDSIQFTLSEQAMLSIEINDERFHNLQLFAGTIEEDIPLMGNKDTLYIETGRYQSKDILRKIKDKKILYFLPGYHIIEDVILELPSDILVYIPGGSAVSASFTCEEVEQVEIRGRGIIYLGNHKKEEGHFNGFTIEHSRNISIEGLLIINPIHYTIHFGQSEYIKVSNIKTFSCEGWSDGFDMMSCTNINISNCFLRTSDDCIAIYGRRWKANGPAKNIVVKDCVLWADVAHPMMIGVHGDYENGGNIIEDISFENIDVLEHHEPQMDYLGCMTIDAGDKNRVRNVTYKNIRIEEFEHGKLFDIQVFQNPKYNPVPGNLVENIYFENIFYTGSGEEPSTIKGYDKDRKVKNITLKNFFINGKHVLSAKEGNIEIKAYTENIKFL